MKTVAIIPARGGSKGIPKKPLVYLKKKPLIAWSIEQALSSNKIDKILVITDNEEVASVSNKYGVDSFILPDELTTDESTLDDAIKYTLESIRYDDIELVVLLQPTSPLRMKDDISGAIAAFRYKKADSLFSSVLAEDTFIWEISNDELISVNYDYKNRKRRQDINNQFIENGSIYIFKPEILFECNNRLGGKIITYVMKDWQVYEIDSFIDLRTCETLMIRCL